MQCLVLLELDEQCIEGFEVLGGGLGVEIEDGGEGEAEEEVVCCAAGEFGGLEVAELEEVGFGEEEGVEPVDAAFMAIHVIIVSTDFLDAIAWDEKEM